MALDAKHVWKVSHFMMAYNNLKEYDTISYAGAWMGLGLSKYCEPAVLLFIDVTP